MTLDITKPVQTRDGRPAKITSVEPDRPYPLRGEIGGVRNCWLEDGSFDGADSSGWDLVNVPLEDQRDAAMARVAQSHAEVMANNTWRHFRDDAAKRILASASRDWLTSAGAALPTNDEVICRRAIERADELVRQLRAA